MSPHHLGKIYRGKRTEQGCVVTAETNEEVQSLDPRLKLWSHSPTGFDWGYGGSGPAQLGLALLADSMGDDVAIAKHQAFKWEVLACLEKDEWQITGIDALDRMRGLSEGARYSISSFFVSY